MRRVPKVPSNGSSDKPARSRFVRSPLRPTMRVGLFTAEEWHGIQAEFHLSGRELLMLQLTCQNLSWQEMARQLGITVHSIHTYCDRLHRKMNAENRVGLVLTAVRFVLNGRK